MKIEDDVQAAQDIRDRLGLTPFTDTRALFQAVMDLADIVARLAGRPTAQEGKE